MYDLSGQRITAESSLSSNNRQFWSFVKKYGSLTNACVTKLILKCNHLLSLKFFNKPMEPSSLHWCKDKPRAMARGGQRICNKETQRKASMKALLNNLSQSFEQEVKLR